tara:strand:+ start:998 stop:1396 length:399 start_codon:yes stop_codon:yes gene_type:complete
MITNVIASIINPISGLLDKVIEDKDTKAQMAHEIATVAANAAQAQIHVNAIEAKHPSVFVSGWRPSIGWVCSLSMLLNYILIPFVNLGLEIAELDIQLAMIDMETMLPVLFSLLGLGGMRTAEKFKLVERNK